MKMKTAPMGQNSWDCYGATVDTTDLKKQLSVLNASLHQAETIKTRLEQQMDNLDVTDTYYDKKISDLQRRLDAQYDRIDEVEETRAELTKATYDEIKKYVAEHNAGMKVSNLYISQVKRKCGIEVGKNYNLPKNEDSRQPQCPEDKESAIVEALKYFKMIQSKKESDKSEFAGVIDENCRSYRKQKTIS